MQYQAVIERQEIIFIDYQGGYAVQDGVGGRLIVLAWQFAPVESRHSLNQPVKMELVHYREEVKALHRRIMSEFPPALERVREKFTGRGGMRKQGRILPLKSDAE
jgi:hypothetical protein